MKLMNTILKQDAYNGSHKLEKGQTIFYRITKNPDIIEVFIRQKRKAPIVKEWSEFDARILL